MCIVCCLSNNSCYVLIFVGKYSSLRSRTWGGAGVCGVSRYDYPGFTVWKSERLYLIKSNCLRLWLVRTVHALVNFCLEWEASMIMANHNLKSLYCMMKKKIIANN